VIFIFATTEAHKIPATILSRCQRYDFRRISVSLITNTLTRIAKSEGVDVDSESLRLISHEATGSLRDAESLLDQAVAFSGESVSVDTIKSMLGVLDRKRLFDLAGAIVDRNPKKSIALLEDAFQAGVDLVRFAMDLLEFLRHMLVLAECGDERGVVDLPADEIKLLNDLIAEAKAPELHRMFSLWYGVAENVSRSPFPKMLLEIGLIRLCRVGDVKRIDDVIANINAVIGDGTMPIATKPTVQSQPPARHAFGKAEADGQPESKPESDVTKSLSFEPAASKEDEESKGRWQEFMRWVVVQKPQVASILQHGLLVGVDKDIIKLAFNNPLYADMLSEDDRKKQVEDLFETFFKRRMMLAVGKSAEAPEGGPKGLRKKDLMREALGNDIVRKTADILNARLHDVKVDGEESS